MDLEGDSPGLFYGISETKEPT